MFKPLSIAIAGALLAACGGKEPVSQKVDYQTLQATPQSEGALVLVDQTKLTKHISNGIRLQTSQGYMKALAMNGGPSAPTGGLAEDGIARPAPAPSPSGDGFSQTNVHVLGVDEADYAKYDGNYWFLATEPQYEQFNISRQTPGIKIIKTDPATPNAEVVSEFHFDDQWGDIGQLYLVQENAETTHVASVRNQWGNVMPYLPGFPIGLPEVTLVDPVPSVDSGSTTVGKPAVQAQIALIGDIFWPGPQNSKVLIELVDVKDPSAPAKDWSIELDGSLINSRKVGNTLYLVTRFDPWIRGIAYENGDLAVRSANEDKLAGVPVSQLMPNYRIGDAELPLSTNCYVQSGLKDNYGLASLVHITAIDLAGQKLVSSQCVNSNVESLSMSTNALYLTGSTYESKTGGGTVIHKFDLQEKGPRYSATGKVPGYVTWSSDPAFRMNEFEDQFRIVTTEQLNTGPSHKLSILTQKGATLETLSTLPNAKNPAPIGKPGEEIYSVRFEGKKAYVVTFQRKDPLYALDLSDPKNPVIAGELEIPGFATYMHPIGDYLFTLGQDADENGRVTGLKAELISIANNTPEVVSTVDLGGRNSHSAGLDDLRAISFLPAGKDTMRIALPVTAYNENDKWLYTGTQLLEVSGITTSAALDNVGVVITEDNSSGKTYPSYGRSRSALHDDAIFVSYNNDVWAANWFYPKDVVGPIVGAPVFCTKEFRMGLNVTLDLVDELGTNKQAACDAKVTAYDNDYSELLQPMKTDSPDQCVFVGAGERAGAYYIVAELPGFPIGEAKAVVYRDECHVQPENVAITIHTDEPVFCTTEVRPSIALTLSSLGGNTDICDAKVYVEQKGNVYPLDLIGGFASASSDAVITLPGETTAKRIAPPMAGCQFSGPFELAGDMVLFVDHPNYEPIKEAVTVPKDQCHVQTQSLSYYLSPL